MNFVTLEFLQRNNNSAKLKQLSKEIATVFHKKILSRMHASEGANEIIAYSPSKSLLYNKLQIDGFFAVMKDVSFCDTFNALILL